MGAHGDQKYNGQPYVAHLDAVAEVLHRFGYDDVTYQEAAYLHDVLEDTDTEVMTLDAEFRNPVVAAVEFCTDPEGASRKERKALAYRAYRIAIDAWRSGDLVYDYVPVGIRVKLADRLANLEASRGTDFMGMYLREGAEFRAALYTPGICDAMWAEYDAYMADGLEP
jgi:(p)ppGpp synthase/HD superfamily hydrolase